jgi:hypothetical protein
MRLTTLGPAVLGALLLLGCNDLDVGDLNAPGVTETQDSPTRVGVLSLATGLQIGGRFGVGQQNGYVALLGILGREVYNFDPADPRFITEMVVGPLDGGSPAFGGNLYQQFYSNIRTANVLLQAMDNLSDTPPLGMSPAEKEATLGYVQTLKAYDYLRVINTRDDLGAPVEVNIDPTGPPAPIKTKAEVFAAIVALLDSGQTQLQAVAAAPFPFLLSPGYAGFDTPATFLKFNRALRARVAVYLADYAGALTALSTSFLDTTQPLTLGVYHSFSTAPGDSINNLFDPNARAIVMDTALISAAQKQVDNVTPDKRIVDKTRVLSSTKSTQGLSSNLAENVYRTNSDGVPIIRNEELILLRAEANIGLNDLAAALTDINFIRQTSGNLPPLAGFASQTAALDELLYNKRYSLLFEGGHRWIDLRRYNRLTDIPKENTTAGPRHLISRFPFPTNECLSRNPAPAAGCSPQAGT